LVTGKSVGLISLGCPKATVDSEEIVTNLLDLGYEVKLDGSPDVVVINTCGFIDAARDESLEAIRQTQRAGKEVVITGCLGAEKALLAAEFPALKFVSGPAQVAPVVDAVRSFLPVTAVGSMAQTLGGEDARTRLTEDHFAYLKISEGCNHHCSFCIIPTMRGKLKSRNLAEVVREAKSLVDDGVQELAVIAQDLGAYGVDLKYREVDIDGSLHRTDLMSVCRLLGNIAPWVRLHYVYPYPHMDRLIPLMRDGHVLPYLDIPLQHASARVLKAMRRPAAAERSLERIRAWREICPDLAIRSTFIVGFPGETDEDVGLLLDFLEAAQLDRVGCFTYSAVEGASANLLDGHLEEWEKLDRQERVYEVQADISRHRLQRHVGSKLRVLIDRIKGEVAIGRSMFDAAEIDGVVYVHGPRCRVGEFAWVEIERSDAHDLYGRLLGQEIGL